MAKTDAFDQKILDAVEEHGWFCMSVFDPEDVAPRFSYSIGFTKSLGQPEFIIFGLPADVAHGVLWNVFRALKDGRSPEDLEPWPDLIENYDCVARRVHPSQVRREYLNSAMWLWGDPEARGGPLPVMQLVWPDRDGRFPWDEGCDPGARDNQPALYVARGH